MVAGVLACSAVCCGAAVEEEVMKEERPLVQLAVLLDTSGSMDGMIAQAKSQLWSIVNEFATAKRDGQRPVLEVALYHYGTPSLGADNGYVRQLAPLTDDLDKISEELFALNTSGGDEYCGWVIQSATKQLKWSEKSDDYKAIFIAGNESFAQGGVNYKGACKDAIKKGIIVNTIHCAGGADDAWADGARRADGTFMKIDGSKAVAEIETPQDKELVALNDALNKTYIAYGKKGAQSAARQAAVDSKSSGLGRGNLSQRVASKASHQYRNTAWDLVDALDEDAVKLEDVKDKDLPKAMKKMTLEERKAYVAKKQAEREGIQKEIKVLSAERNKFIAEKRKEEAESNKDTLGNQIREAVRDQAEAKGFDF
ncbi:MAG: VWA domain-containing protein [Lentisphaerae bacterium]|nr:VWA domain-containing protein [Lentisphaerota bacterium]